MDRRKQGLKRSVAVEAGGILLAAVPVPANRRDDGLLAVTLDAIEVVGSLPAQPVVHLDAGYDDRQIFAITMFVALRLAFSTVNDALGAQPDAELAATVPDQVRDAVAFGRPAAG